MTPKVKGGTTLETENTIETAVEEIQTVRMVRDVPHGPTVADVHPDEVKAFEAGGWTVDTSQASEPSRDGVITGDKASEGDKPSPQRPRQSRQN